MCQQTTPSILRQATYQLIRRQPQCFRKPLLPVLAVLGYGLGYGRRRVSAPRDRYGRRRRRRRCPAYWHASRCRLRWLQGSLGLARMSVSHVDNPNEENVAILQRHRSDPSWCAPGLVSSTLLSDSCSTTAPMKTRSVCAWPNYPWRTRRTRPSRQSAYVSCDARRPHRQT